MLDAKIASASKRIISNQYFRRRVNVEEQTAQKYDRFQRGRQSAYMIYDHFLSNRRSWRSSWPLRSLHCFFTRRWHAGFRYKMGTKFYNWQVKHLKKISRRVCTRWKYESLFSCRLYQRCTKKRFNETKQCQAVKDWRLWLRDKATFYSLTEAWVMLGPSSKKPEEREFVVDPGASMHMLSKKDLSSEEVGTVKRSRNPAVVLTANG